MDKYGLIGYPLKHSFSITYFNEKFQSENIDAEYVNFEIPRIEASRSPSNPCCNPITARPCCWARAAPRKPSTTAWPTWA